MRDCGKGDEDSENDYENGDDVHTLCKAATCALIDSSTSQKYDIYYNYFEKFLGSLRERHQRVSKNVAVEFVQWAEKEGTYSAQSM